MLIPLNVPRRNHVILNYSGSYEQLAQPLQLIGYPVDTRFPALANAGSGIGGPSHYYITWLKPDGSVYGIFYNSPPGGTGGYCVTLNQAGDVATIIADLTTNPILFTDIHIPDLNGISNTGQLFPVTTGSIAYPAGYHLNLWNGGETGLFNFAAGRGIIASSVAAGNGDYSLSTVASTFNAFQNDTGFDIAARQMLHSVANGLNYTLLDAPPVGGIGNAVYMVKWHELPFGGAFSQTNYQLVLSVADDNTFFQALNDNNDVTYNRYIRSNTQNILVVAVPNINPVTQQVAFVFAPDFSWYDRIDVAMPNSNLSDAIFFQDIDGNNYVLGNGAVPSITFAQINPQNPANVVSLEQAFSLGCWSPCYNLLYRMIQ